MVEINNQREAFLDMLAWSEETDNGRQKTRNHGYDVIVGGELFTDYSDHPRKLVTLNPKLKSTGAGLPSFFPVGGMPTASSLAWKTSLRKVRTLCSRLRAWRFTYDWSWWYPSGNRPLQQLSGLRRALVMVRFERRYDSLIAKFKSGRNGQRDWYYEQSHRDYLCSGYLHIIVCLSWAVNHYRDNAITYKAQRDKNARELKLANAAITDMQMRQRDVAALDAKYTKELADAKAENDALRDDVAAGRRRLHIKAVCQSVREATTASGVDNAASPDWQTPLNRIISPSERGWSLCKNNWKEPRSNEQCR